MIDAFFNLPGRPEPSGERAALADDDNTVFELGAFLFESGATLPNARLSYVTHGALNESKDNVILLPSWYGGDHHGYDVQRLE